MRQARFLRGRPGSGLKNELRLRIKLESKREDRLAAEASSTLRIVDESNDGKVY